MDTATYEVLKECSTGCKMALNSIEQLAVYLKDQDMQDLFCKYKEEYEQIEKEAARLSGGETEEEKISEKAAETFAWFSAEMKLLLNDDHAKIAEMMIDGANMGLNPSQRNGIVIRKQKKKAFRWQKSLNGYVKK